MKKYIALILILSIAGGYFIVNEKENEIEAKVRSTALLTSNQLKVAPSLAHQTNSEQAKQPVLVKKNNRVEVTETNDVATSKVNNSDTILVNAENNDPIFKKFKLNESCFGYFEYSSEQKINDYLIDESNIDPNLTQVKLNKMRIFMEERVKRCHSLVDGRSEAVFFQDSLNILKQSANSGNSQAQLGLYIILSNMSASEEVTYDKSNDLYKESLDWLKASVESGNSKSKVMLALEYMDPIYRPEYLNLKEARKLIIEAQQETGSDFSHLLKEIDDME